MSNARLCRCDRCEVSNIFDGDLDRARKAKETLEAVEWLYANEGHILIERDAPGWWVTDDPDGEGTTGATLPEAVAALRANLGADDA